MVSIHSKQTTINVVVAMDNWVFQCYAQILTASRAALGAPAGVCSEMEQRGREAESPSHRDSTSPEERGGERAESPASSGPLQCKLSRLEVNGSPGNPRTRHNGTPMRPLGGNVLQGFKKENWP